MNPPIYLDFAPLQADLLEENHEIIWPHKWPKEHKKDTTIPKRCVAVDCTAGAPA